MVLLALSAMVGALLGLFVRRWLLALVLALAAVGSAQLAAIWLAQGLAGRADTVALAQSIAAVAGVHFTALIPTLAAIGCGAAIAGLLMAWVNGRRRPVALVPGEAALEAPLAARKRRRGVFGATVEDRPVHAAAHNRLQRILDQ